ncbi:MAG TPA: phosphate uptake regulator PhoU [Candidatus Caldiarchaeum subterraneum]|uniref:Phosphate uptake regulator PhoU n=1 Tax=Caldiarchaeum subterraneum TaxID=311458 RepID=A0A832ZUZ3_CALS0|nr:phosphate uptake regulator PhoU [Aigarchaeota archaeon]HIQ29424.1 phosphate uptake regulator PhoU [Candidatus Caldarchaeum subterraneum]
MGRSNISKPTVRNLQLIKGGSFTLTIPRWWISKQRLRKGSKLFISEDGPSLRIVSTAILSSKKRTELNLDAVEDVQHVIYMIWTYYMQGLDEIVVSSSSPISADGKRQLRAVRMDLPGIDIVREDERSVVFSVSGEFDDITLDEVIKNMHSMVLAVQRDAVRAVVEGNIEMAREVVERESEILRIYRRVIRQIALCSMNPQVAYRSGVNNSRELITYAVLARDLSRAVYHSLYVARHIARYGKPLEEKTLLDIIQNMSGIAYGMSVKSVEAFLEKDIAKVLETTDNMHRVRELDEELNRKTLETVKETDKAVTILLIGRELRRVAGYAVAMADIAANRILGPETE